jgi:uncharacterized protein involved in type VI secretion and phage assembly
MTTQAQDRQRPTKSKEGQIMATPALRKHRGKMNKKYFGKYRGVVVNNADPKQMGRIQAAIPELFGTKSSGWAMPCALGPRRSASGSALPKVGAGVWVEFERGDLRCPVWTGCWWTADDTPPSYRNK